MGSASFLKAATRELGQARQREGWYEGRYARAVGTRRAGMAGALLVEGGGRKRARRVEVGRAHLEGGLLTE